MILVHLIKCITHGALPAIALKPYESTVHKQRVMHFEGEEDKLPILVKSLFDLDIIDIATRF